MTLLKYIDDCYSKYSLGIKTNMQEQNNIKIPYKVILFDPWIILLNNIKGFIFLSSLISIIQSVVSVLTGNNYICGYGSIQVSTKLHCNENIGIFIINFVLSLCLYGIYAENWIRFLNHKIFTYKNLVINKIKILKFCIINIFFIVINLIPLGSLLILYYRNPNPDWRIEVMFFGVIALGFVVPFITIRFFALFVSIWETEKQSPSLRKIWQKSQGNTLRILSSLSLIFIFSVISSNYLYNDMRLALEDINIYTAIFIDFIHNILCLSIFNLFLNHCILQKKYFSC